MISFKLPQRYNSRCKSIGSYLWRNNNLIVFYKSKNSSLLVEANTSGLKHIKLPKFNLIFCKSKKPETFCAEIIQPSLLYTHRTIPENVLTDPRDWTEQKVKSISRCNYLKHQHQNFNDVIIVTSLFEKEYFMPAGIRNNKLTPKDILIHNYNNNTTYKFELNNPVIFTSFSPDGSLATAMTTKELFFFDI